MYIATDNYNTQKTTYTEMYIKLLTIIIHRKLYRNVYKAMDNYNTQKTIQKCIQSY